MINFSIMPTETKNKKRVLVVEDEKFMLEALIDKLNREGFEVLTAKNGKEGLKLSLQEQPDLILLDIVMPKMDGLTMLKKLRKDSWGRDALVILLTNLNDADKVAEAVEGGMHEYLVKSDWRLDEIVKKIKERLGLIKIA